MKLGVILECFKTDFKTSVIMAKQMGFDGVQVSAAYGEIADSLSDTAKVREVKRILTGEGLEISALCGDIGCEVYYYPSQNIDKLDRLKRMLALAKELDANIVTTHIGVVPTDSTSKRYLNMQKACQELANFADSIGGHFAVETGPEMATTLCGFLDSLNSRGVGVNLDPANLVMCAGEDPVTAVNVLSKFIVHTHAKDGIMLKATDTNRIYTCEHDGQLPIVYDEYFKEMPLGKGAVNFKQYFEALKGIKYNSYLTIEREVGENPADDIKLGYDFLRKFYPKSN